MKELKVELSKKQLEAFNCNELWDIGNGTTLCVKCHRLIHKEVGYRR